MQTIFRASWYAMLALSLVGLSAPVAAQEIQTVPVTDGLFMLTGDGGNIGLSIGEDGAFLIDDKFAPLTDAILDAVAAQTDRPVQFVVNTHWHGDHTGGNENFGKRGAIIVAHENVRRTMSTEQFNATFKRTTPASPTDALPVITFADALTFHWNGNTIDVFHVAPAHTDGDSVIHFEEANVIHTGDTFFNGMYPYIDTGVGGSIEGMIAAADRVLALADDETRIIPGHGPLGTKAQLQSYRDMLATAAGRISALKAEGKTRDEVVAAKPTADLDAQWGGGFMQPDVWVGIVYDSL